MHTANINTLIETLPEAHYWREVLSSLIDYDGSGTISLKSWMQANEGANGVTTLQATFSGDEVVKLWGPGIRAVDASHATYVLLNGSRRDYAGMKCIKATSTTWLGYDATTNTYVIFQA